MQYLQMGLSWLLVKYSGYQLSKLGCSFQVNDKCDKTISLDFSKTLSISCPNLLDLIAKGQLRIPNVNVDASLMKVENNNSTVVLG